MDKIKVERDAYQLDILELQKLQVLLHIAKRNIKQGNCGEIDALDNDDYVKAADYFITHFI